MELRFQTAPATLPVVAEQAPDRGCYVAAVADRCEIFAWDRAADRARQVTDRPDAGTSLADVDPTGRTVWWFDDDLAGIGRWQLQPFGGGPDRLALPDVAAGWDAGLAMATDGTAAIGIADGDGVTIAVRSPQGVVRTAALDRAPATLVDLDPTGSLLAVRAEADGARAVRILERDGSVVSELSGASHPLWPVGFRPRTGVPTLLVVAGVDAGYCLGTWTPGAGLRLAPWWTSDTDIAPSWCPDGRVLIRQDRHARSALMIVDLARRSRTPLPVPSGTVLAARMQPDGDLHYLWTDSVTPPVLHTGSGRRPPGFPAPPAESVPLAGPVQPAESVPPVVRGDEPAGRGTAALRELWVCGPGGTIHTLLSVPTGTPAPWPTVFLVHGGPFQHDRDAYDPLVTVLAAVGCAVARVNYRGSTGYGPAWRAAFDDGVGLTQVADLAAVRADLVRGGLADPERIGLAGWSWGGYLTLLALGTRPGLWCAGAAVHPIADCAAAFAGTTAPLRALDTRLFGGTPEQVPERYARSSPITYADRVRAQVLLVAAENDPKCPPDQIAGYAEALRAHGADPRLVEVRAGHEGQHGAVQAQVLAEVVGFLAGAVGGVTAVVGTR